MDRTPPVGTSAAGGAPDVAGGSGALLARARLRLALDAAGMGLWDWDLRTGRLVWDERSAGLYGTTLAESTGSIADVDARVHPEDLPGVRAELSRAVEEGSAVDVEFRVVWPDGSVHWLFGRGQGVVDGTGRVVRLIGINVDITEQRRAPETRIADAQRMAGLVAVARALSDAEDEAGVLRVVADHGSAALGARGTGLALPDAAGDHVRLLLVGAFDPQVRSELAVLPPDAPLAVVDAAVTGQAHYLPDRASAAARFPGSDDLYRRVGTEAAAAVPLRARGELLGALSVGLVLPHEWRPAERELLETLAALTAQALDRLRARQAEREATRASRRLSETLQRSLLTEPPGTDLLDVAVRYEPAASEAQVGGDWYDAFAGADGALTLVVGDVAGHDQDAAAAMAQVRNVLRGVASCVDGSPGGVLAALDRALQRLQVTTLATAVLGRVRQSSSERTAGVGPASAVLQWSNAGHPPPVLLHPDGRAELLDREPDLLLGLLPSTLRTDHEVDLPVGSTVVLYTDGLVERRDQLLDDGLARLRDTLAELPHLSPQQLADALLERLARAAEDDVALLVARVAGAGPGATAAPPPTG